MNNGIDPKRYEQFGISAPPSKELTDTEAYKSQFGAKKGFGMGSVPSVSQNTPAETTTEAETPAEPGAAYDAMYNQLYSQIQTNREKEQANLEKQRKRDDAWGSISDAANALANLYYTTKGAPNAYDPKSGMSAQAQARYDKARAALAQSDAANLAYLKQLEERRKNNKEFSVKDEKARVEREKLELQKSKQRLAEFSQQCLNEYRAGLLDARKRELEIEADYNAGRITVDEMRAKKAELKSISNGKGSTMAEYTKKRDYKYDAYGRVVSVIETRTLNNGQEVTVDVTDEVLNNGEDPNAVNASSAGAAAQATSSGAAASSNQKDGKEKKKRPY